MVIVEAEVPRNRLSLVHQVVNDLSDAHYIVLKFIIGHLRRVAEHSEQNEMFVHDLATVFGPILMGSEWVDDQDANVSGDALQDIHAQCQVVETIIMGYNEIFD